MQFHVLLALLALYFQPSISAHIATECLPHERQSVIDTLRQVSLWSHVAMRATVRLNQGRFDPEGVFEMSFGSDDDRMRQRVWDRFRAAQLEADRSPGGAVERGTSAVMIRCQHWYDEVCEEGYDLLEVDIARDEIILVATFLIVPFAFSQMNTNRIGDLTLVNVTQCPRFFLLDDLPQDRSDLTKPSRLLTALLNARTVVRLSGRPNLGLDNTRGRVRNMLVYETFAIGMSDPISHLATLRTADTTSLALYFSYIREQGQLTHVPIFEHGEFRDFHDFGAGEP